MKFITSLVVALMLSATISFAEPLKRELTLDDLATMHETISRDLDDYDIVGIIATDDSNLEVLVFLPDGSYYIYTFSSDLKELLVKEGPRR